MSVRVKICGLTNLDDARTAIDAGAHALGFIFFTGSARYITPAATARIIAQLPPFVSKVGVFVDESLDAIRQTADETGIDTIQLHGDETPDLCDALARERFKTIKAFRIKDRSSLEVLPSFSTSAYLLDSYVPGQLGGTGAQFNWDLAIQAATLGTPIILAGGLVPENVRDAVSKVSPYGVDVSSGVESSPGKKDHRRIRAFMAASHFDPKA
ncbi:MAG: phosphoribosylanthranilate isomerase [Limisphaerales bacterium]